MNDDVSEFLFQNLGQYLLPASRYQYVSQIDEESTAHCHKCGSDKHVLIYNKKNMCAACGVFSIQFPMATKDKANSIRQKDTLLIINNNKSIVIGDVSPAVIEKDAPVDIISPQISNDWRKAIAEYILYEHDENKPSLVIFQSKADKSSSFKLSHSPDFVYICGHFNARVNTRKLKAAYDVTKDIPVKDWKSLRYITEDKLYTEKLMHTKQKNYEKLSAKYPKLMENIDALPYPNTPEFDIVGWCVR
jgi:ribosomal protein L37E